MTNKEALAAKVQCPVNDATLEVALTDRGITGASTYTVDSKSDVELAVMDILFMIYTQPDLVEGGYSISHPDFLRKVEARLLQLATLNEATEILDILSKPGPSVTGKSVW